MSKYQDTLVAILLLFLFSLSHPSHLYSSEDPQALFHKAEALLQQENYPKALQSFEEILSIDRSFTQAYRGLVRCYGALGDPQGAVIYMESLFLENPSSAEVSYGLGCAHYSLKNYEEAKRYFENAIKLGPSLAEAWNNCGAIYHFVDKDYDKAGTYYEKAIALSEQSQNARVLEVAKKNLSNLPSSESRLQPVSERLALEDFITRFLESVEKNDDKHVRELVIGQKENCELAVEWFLNQAMASYVQGNTEDEETNVLLARLIEKESREVHENLSSQKKIMLYGALSDDQKRGIIKGDDLIKAGLSLEQKGQIEQALMRYGKAREAFEEGRDHGRVGLALLYEGDAYRKLKDHAHAREAYESALNRFVKTGAQERKALALSSLGITFFYLDEHSNALESLRRAATIYRTLEDSVSEQRVKRNIALIEERINQ